jgi:hypothetical protein
MSAEDFRDLTSALEDKPINIKDTTLPGLSQLSEEFGFEVLSAQSSAHLRLLRLTGTQAMKILSRISTLEKRTRQPECQLAALQPRVSSLLGCPVLKLTCASHLRGHSILRCKGQRRCPPNGRRWALPRMLRPPHGRQLLDRPGWLDWLIVGDFPPLFQEFRLKRWVLLWGGSRDAFRAVITAVPIHGLS